MKKNFQEFSKDITLSWAFDNLIEKIKLLKEEQYKMPELHAEHMRKHLINTTSIKIKELF
ncbi:MAG: hypothetical protein ACTSXH_17195 [Promethearchaeota archaeon]